MAIPLEPNESSSLAWVPVAKLRLMERLPVIATAQLAAYILVAAQQVGAVALRVESRRVRLVGLFDEPDCPREGELLAPEPSEFLDTFRDLVSYSGARLGRPGSLSLSHPAGRLRLSLRLLGNADDTVVIEGLQGRDSDHRFRNRMLDITCESE